MARYVNVPPAEHPGASVAITCNPGSPSPAKPAPPPRLHRVEVLRAALIGPDWRLPGDVVEVDEGRARHLHGTGCGRVVHRQAILGLEDPPLPPMPSVPLDPYPADPRVTVKVASRQLLWLCRVHVKGDEVILPERVALDLAHIGAARIVKGQELSRVGTKYREALRNREEPAVYH